MNLSFNHARLTSLKLKGKAGLVLAFIFALLSGYRSFGAAVVEGRVTLPEKLAVSDTPAVVRYPNQLNVRPAPPEPLTAIIYLEGVSSTTNRTSEVRRVDQRDFQFVPRVLPIQVGSTVEFPNNDDGYHNVFSLSKAKKFDLGRYRRDEAPPRLLFDKPGLVKLYCEIHEHMRGQILVLNTPHFARTAPDGTFRLENVPPGKYTLKAWMHEKLEWSKPIEVPESGSVQVSVTAP
jgi:plastocyanin